MNYDDDAIKEFFSSCLRTFAKEPNSRHNALQSSWENIFDVTLLSLEAQNNASNIVLPSLLFKNERQNTSLISFEILGV